MKAFYEMLKRVTSSPEHDKMIRFSKPLKDFLGVNHFWYYRVTAEGLYTYLGTHSEWNEYCFENHLTRQFPILRHPDTQNEGINLMKQTADTGYSKVLQEAWEKFGINFTINLASKVSEGIEAFGFATESICPEADERILNELPLLNLFIQEFRKKHRKLFDIAFENQVNISYYIGSRFYSSERVLVSDEKRIAFLKKMGWLPLNPLTKREMGVLQWIAKGYSAPYIAKQLCLSVRTVENYVSILKEKLYCSSKDALIKKANILTIF